MDEERVYFGMRPKFWVLLGAVALVVGGPLLAIRASAPEGANKTTPESSPVESPIDSPLVTPTPRYADPRQQANWQSSYDQCLYFGVERLAAELGVAADLDQVAREHSKLMREGVFRDVAYVGCLEGLFEYEKTHN